MTPEQRRRAGKAVEHRIAEMNATLTTVATAAAVSPKTIRSVINGEHWPTDAVQSGIESALRWREGELHARSVQDGTDGAIDALSDVQLAEALAARLRDRERRSLQMRRRNGPPET